ncbi:hypothetical protein UA08_07175 [Talaromyces atroroseus]|uniref:Uncharacterized protein n=1 Tax=Talaromyces atroroseus TaxID=1441469 RepID=A0A225AVX0_TALAT|nr:hypothetical protein UA08_07175 [Talaromyces atroroseus]OKL57637.1 hypothetical protein UA08_07175 [Talaromyces atroroseus]
MPASTDESWRRSDLHEQVQDMISKYESIKPSHALRYIIGTSKLYVLFCELIEHHIGIILSRSQEIEDGHITVYDKCLLDLCGNGREVHRQAGQELYIREFLGIDPDSLVERDVEEMLDREILARGVFVRSSRPLTPACPRSVSAEDEKVNIAAPPLEDHGPPFSTTSSDTYGTNFARNSAVNTNIKRMLHIYFEAKSDFYRIESSQSPPSSSDDYQRIANAAKFLRDSAENALDYLQAQDLITSHCDELMAELQAVFKYAKSRAIECLGGRKRRFEIEGRNRYYYNSNKPSSLSPAREARRGSFRSDDRVQDSPQPRIHRRVADRYSGSGSHHQHLWHPYARHEGSRSRRSAADRKSF